MAATDLSPNVDNYFIGKGIVFFRVLGGNTWRDLGNVPQFEFSSAVERLNHYSSRGGVRTRDKTVITEKNATLRAVLEEFTGPNLAMYLLGTQTGEDDTAVVEIMSQSEIIGSVLFFATNDIGPRWHYHLERVSFSPSGSLSPIGDEWGNLELSGDVEAVTVEGNLRFGRASRDVTMLGVAELPDLITAQQGGGGGGGGD